MRSLIRVIYFLIAIAIHNVHGQTYSFQHIGVEEGLSQSVVTTVLQDNQGVFWIGTMSGITRYDGNSFEVYMKSHGLAENWITSSLLDMNGNLWFGHWGGGVSFYDIHANAFKDMKLERFSKFKTITSILQDSKGDIWFGTNGSGVFKYEIESNTIVSIAENEGFQSNYVNSMCLDHNQNIWFGTNEGVVIYRTNKKFEEKGAFMVLTQQDGLPSNHIKHLSNIGNDKIAVSTEIHGLCIVSNVSKLDDLSFKIINMTTGLPSNEIISTYCSDGNTLWIGTRNEGIVRYALDQNAIQLLSTRQGLNYHKVNTIFSDREKNFWIGTDLGLNQFRGDEFLIYDENDGILNNVVWAISQDHQDRILLGTNEGLSRITFIKNEKSGSTDRLEVKNYSIKNGLSDNIVLSIYVNDDNDIWCGTGFGGISIISNNGIKKIDSLSGLISNTVYSIVQDDDANYWIGTDKGASEIMPSGKIKNYTSKDGLGGDNIYKVYKDSKGIIWFASIGGFLTKFEDDQFTRFDSSYKLTQKFITSITEDKDGNIWFGAYGAGIYKFDGKKFINYNKNDGLSSNSPYSIVADGNNNIWIGTSQGIDKFNLKDLTFKNYREKEGFMGIEPNPNSVWNDSDGNVWFGTIMGAVKFNLSFEKMNVIEPITIVEGLKVDNEIFEFPEGNEFAHNENHITFEYIGISLTNPEHVQYKYKLEGFDREWSPVTSAKDVIYSNIPPGTFEFKVMASNNDGIWNELPTTYKFLIRSPFWMTWWFYTLCGIALITGLYIGDRIRTKNLIASKRRLERKVEIRTQEIATKNIELERKNKDILDSINYARRIQTAMLPSEHHFKEHLSNSFIFFKPKDIVSGDFYWMERMGDKILFAAADCTGHGVPGAFMSIIGHNGLNKAIVENGVFQPAAILDQLNVTVSETLKQSGQEEVKDGMDISMCCLDLKTMELEFAGAFNPLYLVRNGELIETKADRQPIGSFVGEQRKKFTNHTIKLQKNDAIYIFSDGFPDQFGGPKGKKFRYKQFRELLVESHDKHHEKIPLHLDKVINDWRGEIEQIDDIVVIGVKVT